MAKLLPGKDEILDAIRLWAQKLGRPPSRAEFKAKSRMTEYQVLQHFPSWREALRAAGLEPEPTNVRLDDSELLKDWGTLVRTDRQIPTRDQYRRGGKYSPGTFESHFGPWSRVPARFRQFAEGKDEWADVLALLPVISERREAGSTDREAGVDPSEAAPSAVVSRQRHAKLQERPTYGNPIDFRGLRHEPENEEGVVFLFGMVARELGYLVEAIQAGFPDCEAKRQFDAGKWQPVRIEFEYESRNFRDHGHPTDGCDVIVCWRHNWPNSPSNLEIVELKSVIRSLAKSEE